VKRYLLYASELYCLPVLRPLEREIRRRGGEAAWFVHGIPAESLGRDERRLHTVAEVKQFDPRAVFVPANHVPDFFPGIKVQLFHGFSVGKRSDHRGHFRIRGLFDLYCTQGSTTTSPFRELSARHGHFRVVETGWPKMDPLFQPDAPRLPWPADWHGGRPVVLYASTFTQGISSAPVLLPALRELTASGTWSWILTLHPKSAPALTAAYRELCGPRVRWVGADELVPAMREADLLLSDTSSAIHEFLLQRRPVVTFRTRHPGPHLIDVQEPSGLPGAIAAALAPAPELMRAIDELAERIHPYRDGRSSARVLDALDEFEERHRGRLRRKPLNLWRRLRMRRQLGYLRLR
jgi:CDP-glycerol glycerophosphotransferase (TagB/SpsB family)